MSHRTALRCTAAEELRRLDLLLRILGIQSRKRVPRILRIEGMMWEPHSLPEIAHTEQGQSRIEVLEVDRIVGHFVGRQELREPHTVVPVEQDTVEQQEPRNFVADVVHKRLAAHIVVELVVRIVVEELDRTTAVEVRMIVALVERVVRKLVERVAHRFVVEVARTVAEQVVVLVVGILIQQMLQLRLRILRIHTGGH
jgi:hypothetical protein